MKKQNFEASSSCKGLFALSESASVNLLRALFVLFFVRIKIQKADYYGLVNIQSIRKLGNYRNGKCYHKFLSDNEKRFKN